MKFNLKNLQYDSGSIEVKNIMDPIIRLASYFVTPLGLALIVAGIIYNMMIFLYIVVLVVVALIIFFMYQYNQFAKKDPDRLHSEKYLLERRKLDIEQFSKHIPTIPTSDYLVLDSPESTIGTEQNVDDTSDAEIEG